VFALIKVRDIGQCILLKIKLAALSNLALGAALSSASSFRVD